MTDTRTWADTEPTTTPAHGWELADPDAPGDGRSDSVEDAELLVRLASFAALPSA